jgi:RNA polymerase sigma-70 factor, ECF subfamily
VVMDDDDELIARLAGIARRQAALWLRRQGRVDDLVIALHEGARRVSEDPTEAVVARADLAEAVESLGAEDGPERVLWRLLFVEDRPVAQVAAMTSVPTGTVKSRAHRVRRLMRAALLGHRPAPEGSR